MSRPVTVSTAELIAELRRLADGKYAPTFDAWNRERNKEARIPTAEYLTTHYPGGWKALVREAGLVLPNGRGGWATRRKATALDVPLSDCERHACANRGLYERGW